MNICLTPTVFKYEMSSLVNNSKQLFQYACLPQLMCLLPWIYLLNLLVACRCLSVHLFYLSNLRQHMHSKKLFPLLTGALNCINTKPNTEKHKTTWTDETLQLSLLSLDEQGNLCLHFQVFLGHLAVLLKHGHGLFGVGTGSEWLEINMLTLIDFKMHHCRMYLYELWVKSELIIMHQISYWYCHYILIFTLHFLDNTVISGIIFS